MGYCSELDLIRKTEYVDRSYHGFEEQLLWRYDDLRNRYFDLMAADAPRFSDDRFTTNDYRYVPVECFHTIADVYRAMEMAKEDLEDKCGIIVREDGSIESQNDVEQDPDQITMLEIVLLPTWFQTAVAA